MHFIASLTRIAVATAASVIAVQSVFSQPLPVASNRPEREIAAGSFFTQATPPASGPSHAATATTLTPVPPAHAARTNPSKTRRSPSGHAPTLEGAAKTADPESAVEPDDALGVTAGQRFISPPQPPVVKSAAASTGASSGPLPPKQGLMGPEVFSIDVPMNRQIKQYLDYYTSPAGLEWLRIVLRRAEPFRYYIASRIQHYRMPPELLYLPIVESTYSPYAISESGAAGLWQFMTNSVYPYNLQINEWLDDRFDFWKSTNASLEKLKYNYQVLGNWLLALAAYNAGLGYVQGVVERTGIHNVWKLGAEGYLPYETRVYIPKFLAIAAVCSYAGRYGLPLSWEAPLQWTRIQLDQAVDLRILARESGITEGLLLEGNAELRYYITPPGDSHYYLKVPKRDSKVIERVLKQQRFHLMRFYVYRIEAGDTLYDLSRYYGVPVSMILQYNPDVSARYLQIGQRVVIPGLKNVPPYTHSMASRLPSPGPKITLHDPTGQFTGLYTVKPGDTLWGISQRFGITPAELARVNGIRESTIITDGTVLHVPGAGALITQGAY